MTIFHSCLIPYGLDHRIVETGPSASAPSLPGYNYEHTTRQALDFLETLNTLNHSSSACQEPLTSRTRIGILISCFWPEQYLDNFLNNLLLLENSKRILPIFINAGMEDSSREAIMAIVESDHFFECGYIERQNCTIYEAWNLGIKAFADKVDYFTNFNVDDLRHPLCLEAQAASLDTFLDKHVSITDYLFFFETNLDLKILYQDYIKYSTFTPVVNLRTLTFRNFPHSAPMWRSSIHKNFDLYFDELSSSAADSDLWFRLSHQCHDSFFVISLPLSLYYFNPNGLSTSSNSKGPEESRIYIENHYSKIKALIETTILHRHSKSLDNINQYNLFSLQLAHEVLSEHV